MKQRTPLSGADAFLLAVERMMLAAGQGRHLGLTVLELGPGFDAARFRFAVERIAAASPLASARLRHPPACIPHWEWTEETRATFPVGEHAPGMEREAFCETRLNDAGDAPVRFDVLPRADGTTTLIMSWQHFLLDGRGAELLLAEIARLAADPAAAARADSWGPAPPRAGGWRGRLGEAERFKDHFYENARIGIDSLSGAEPRAGAARFALEHFSAEETSRLAERASGITRGLFSLAWFLAVTMRAHRTVFQKRGAEPESYQASCAVQERKRGARHPIWQNHVSQLFFCLRREEAADLENAARALHEQFTTLSKAKMPQAFATMTGLFRRMPTSWYLRFIRGNSGGHITSFFYSHTGQFLPECAEFAGAKVDNGWHIPSVSAPPGSGIFFSERSGRLTATIAWREGAVSAEEIALLRATLREDLLGR